MRFWVHLSFSDRREPSRLASTPHAGQSAFAYVQRPVLDLDLLKGPLPAKGGKRWISRSPGWSEVGPELLCPHHARANDQIQSRIQITPQKNAVRSQSTENQRQTTLPLLSVLRAARRPPCEKAEPTVGDTRALRNKAGNGDRTGQSLA
jgi:hypothetical protein